MLIDFWYFAGDNSYCNPIECFVLLNSSLIHFGLLECLLFVLLCLYFSLAQFSYISTHFYVFHFDYKIVVLQL